MWKNTQQNYHTKKKSSKRFKEPTNFIQMQFPENGNIQKDFVTFKKRELFCFCMFFCFWDQNIEYFHSKLSTVY